MSKDIRSYFTLLSKKPGNNSTSNNASSTAVKKRAVRIESSDEDVIEATPDTGPKKNEKKTKKRKVQVISSDSESESSASKPKPVKKSERKVLSDTLKPVNALDVFGNTPIKQTKAPQVEKLLPEEVTVTETKPRNKRRKKVMTETGIHDDPDFEKTLLELDEEFLLENVDILDKTIDDAISKASASKSEHSNVGDNGTEGRISPKAIDGVTKSPKATDSVTKSSSRKRKISEAEDSGLDKDQERYEKRRQSAILYQQYLKRSGPARHGAKELPKGKPDCLKGLCFLRTGVLDSLEGDEFNDLVKEHGGRTVHSVSKKVNYVVMGEEPGPSKLEKAQNFGIKTISEDELLDLILTKSGLPPKYVVHEGNNCDKNNEEPATIDHILANVEDDFKESKKLLSISLKEEPKSKPNLRKLNSYNSEEKRHKVEPKDEKRESEKDTKESKSESKEVKKRDVTNESKRVSKESQNEAKKVKKQVVELKDEIPELTFKIPHNDKSKKFPSPKKTTSEHTKITARKALEPIERHVAEIPEINRSWTEKYKPTNIKGIIGQQGDKSNMKKLLFWLQNWYKNHSGKNKPKLAKPSPWAKNDDGSYFKCALLSGPPGVGKTTTATLVAQELGFDIVEFNASDTRSKKLLHEEVSQLLSTTSIASFVKDGSTPSKKHVLLMDEVDGMAGNEDRGGIQELIVLIQNSSVPIICMCNDRNHSKIRSLANHCLDLRFSRPRLEQIRGAMNTVCFREGLTLSSEALSQVINGAGMDIRQTLNNLSMWTAAEKNLTAEVAQKEANSAKKDTVIGPWEVVRKVFSEDEHKGMSLSDRSKLFFYDYSLGPLFVQENYLQVVPHCPKSEVLQRIADTADSLSTSVVIENKIRSTNNWSLLEMQGMFASVLPGHYMEGHVGGQINFPGWLGKNSRRGKFVRLLSELQAHMRTSTSASRLAVNLDYIYHLRDNIIRHLTKEGSAGVDKSLEIMHAYNLLREDFDSLVELSKWPRHKDPMAMVDSKVKAAFTRAYNKEGTKLPYAIPSAAVKKKVTALSAEDELYGDDEAESSPEDDEDVGKDAMIKAKKKPATKAKKDKEGGGTSRNTINKGRGKKSK